MPFPFLIRISQSGVLLCRLANVLSPGSVPSSVYQGRVAFLQAQNIEMYLRICAKAGIPKPNMFEVADLQEERNVPLVFENLAALSSTICAMKGYSGPGPLAPPPEAVAEKPAVDEAEARKPPATKEEKELVEWANGWLRKVAAPQQSMLVNLSADAKSAIKLVRLTSALTGARPLSPCVESPAHEFECAQNAAILITFVEQQTLAPVTACTAQDIASGDVGQISAFVSFLRDRFDVDFHFRNIVAAGGGPAPYEDIKDYAPPSSPRPAGVSVVVPILPLALKPPASVAPKPPGAKQPTRPAPAPPTRSSTAMRRPSAPTVAAPKPPATATQPKQSAPVAIPAPAETAQAGLPSSPERNKLLQSLPPPPPPPEVSQPKVDIPPPATPPKAIVSKTTEGPRSAPPALKKSVTLQTLPGKPLPPPPPHKKQPSLVTYGINLSQHSDERSSQKPAEKPVEKPVAMPVEKPAVQPPAVAEIPPEKPVPAVDGDLGTPPQEPTAHVPAIAAGVEESPSGKTRLPSGESDYGQPPESLVEAAATLSLAPPSPWQFAAPESGAASSSAASDSKSHRRKGSGSGSSAIAATASSTAAASAPTSGAAAGATEQGAQQSEKSQLSMHRDKGEAPAPPPTFNEMMQSPVLKKVFMDFLEERHAAENMQFLVETANFAKHEMPKEQMLEEAKRIYEKFCRPNAPNEANIGGVTLENLRQQFGASGDPSGMNSKLFARAHVEVSGLIQGALFIEWTRQPIDWAEARVNPNAQKKHKNPAAAMVGNVIGSLRAKSRLAKAQNLIRLKIATELLQTEERYVNALNTCKQHLAKPKASTPSDELSPDEISGVFASFAYFHFHHKRFLDSLRERVAVWAEGTTVGDLFLENSRLFTGYTQYCRQYADALARLHTVISLRKPLRQSRLVRLGDLQTAESLDATLEQYVMLPTQRLPQYLFVLLNLFRYTAKTHGDYGLLHQAITETRAAVEEIMRVIDAEAAPHTHKLLSVATSIEGKGAELLVVPRRRFVREGVMASVSFTSRHSSSSAPTTCTVRRPYVFLFEDVIVCCEQGSRDKEKPFTFVSQLDIADIRAIHVNQALIIELSLHMGIMKTTASPVAPTSPSQVNMLSWVMRALKEDDRFQWESDIARLVDQARVSFRRNTGSASTIPRPLPRALGRGNPYATVSAAAASAYGVTRQRQSGLQAQTLRIHGGLAQRPRLESMTELGSAGGAVGATSTQATSAPQAAGSPRPLPRPLPHPRPPMRPQPPVPAQRPHAASAAPSVSTSISAAAAAAASPAAATKLPSTLASPAVRARQGSYSEGSATAAEGVALSTPVVVRNRQPSFESSEIPQPQPIAPPPPNASTVLGASLGSPSAIGSAVGVGWVATPSLTEEQSFLESASDPPTPLKSSAAEQREAAAAAAAPVPATAPAPQPQPQPQQQQPPKQDTPPIQGSQIGAAAWSADTEWRASNMLVVYDVPQPGTPDEDPLSDTAVQQATSPPTTPAQDQTPPVSH